MLSLLAGLLLATPALATDLEKIDRRLVKEPVYQDQPRYLLLVLGAQAQTRLWLVLDGHTLYVDRNGNGDLTEPGERFVPKDKDVDYPLTFEVGEIGPGDGSGPAGKLMVKMDKTESELTVDIPGQLQLLWNGKQFAESVATAPIVHFYGPRHMVLDSISRQKPGLLQRGGKRNQIYTRIITPSLGAEASVLAHYNDNPDKIHPIAEVEFPSRSPGGPPIRQKLELTTRC
jgi:hypothetical protein